MEVTIQTSRLQYREDGRATYKTLWFPCWHCFFLALSWRHSNRKSPQSSKLFSRNAMNIDYTLFSNTQLLDAIDSLMERSERDEAMRAELAAQLENIYNTLADASFRDLFGALDAAIDNHIALSDALDSRAELLDALMPEYGNRMAKAMPVKAKCLSRLTHSSDQG